MHHASFPNLPPTRTHKHILYMNEGLACLLFLHVCVKTMCVYPKGSVRINVGEKMLVLSVAPSRTNTGLKLFHKIDGCLVNGFTWKCSLRSEKKCIYILRNSIHVKQNIYVGFFLWLNMSLRVLSVHLCCCHNWEQIQRWSINPVDPCKCCQP